MLDRLEIGIAVFGSAGDLAFSNLAFESAIGLDEKGDVPAGIDEVIAAARQTCRRPEAWHAFKGFALAAERNDTWTGEVEPLGGGRIVLRGHALPDGSTMLAAFGPPLAVAAWVVL